MKTIPKLFIILSSGNIIIFHLVYWVQGLKEFLGVGLGVDLVGDPGP